MARFPLHQEWSPVLNQRPGNLSLENDKVPRFTRYVCWWTMCRENGFP